MATVHRAVLGLHQLWAGEFTGSLLAHSPPEVGIASSRLGRAARDLVERRVREANPPWPRPSGPAALQQLSGSGTSVPPPTHCQPASQRVPLRGEIWPADVEQIALPEAGSQAVSMELSPRCAALL